MNCLCDPDRYLILLIALPAIAFTNGFAVAFFFLRKRLFRLRRLRIMSASRPPH
jgi:hypothetical protein